MRFYLDCQIRILPNNQVCQKGDGIMRKTYEDSFLLKINKDFIWSSNTRFLWLTSGPMSFHFPLVGTNLSFFSISTICRIMVFVLSPRRMAISACVSRVPYTYASLLMRVIRLFNSSCWFLTVQSSAS